MAAAPGATAKITQVATPTSPKTTTIDLGSGSGRRLAVCLPSYRDPTATAITVGTDTLTLVSGTHVVRTDITVQIWDVALADSNTGVQTVTVSWSNSLLMIAAYCLVITGSDQANGGANTNNGASPISLGLTSAAGDLTVTCLAADGSGLPTTTAPPGTRDQADGGPYFPTASDHGNGTANPTHTWTTGGASWSNGVMAGVNFRAAVTLNAFTLALASGSHALTGTVATLAQQGFTSWLRVGH